jgi:hypothetical protein
MRQHGRHAGGALLLLLLAAPGVVSSPFLEPLVPVEVLLRTKPANVTAGKPFNITTGFTRLDPRLAIRPMEFRVSGDTTAPVGSRDALVRVPRVGKALIPCEDPTSPALLRV